MTIAMLIGGTVGLKIVITKCSCKGCDRIVSFNYTIATWFNTSDDGVLTEERSSKYSNKHCHHHLPEEEIEC